MTLDSKQRFSNRADDYARYRPGYPAALLELLRRECALTPASIVADIGSGTGLLTKLFLENGNVAYGVEPNAAMREAGEAFLKDYPRFRSVDASAEATTLPDGSVDLVLAGTAFHWFDVDGARAEFRRILKPSRWVVIVVNVRHTDSTPFQAGYESLLRTYCPEFLKVENVYTGYQRMKDFFRSSHYRETSFANEQLFDFEGLRGRLLSSSFAPKEDHANYEPMLAELRRLFDANQQAGLVRFEYKTEVHFGQLR